MCRRGLLDNFSLRAGFQTVQFTGEWSAAFLILEVATICLLVITLFYNLTVQAYSLLTSCCYYSQTETSVGRPSYRQL